MDMITWEEEFLRVIRRPPELASKELKEPLDAVCRELFDVVVDEIKNEAEWIAHENGGGY